MFKDAEPGSPCPPITVAWVALVSLNVVERCKTTQPRKTIIEREKAYRSGVAVKNH